MSLDKAIEHGKEHRSQYSVAGKSYANGCRNHGDCEWCYDNRMYKHKKRIKKYQQRLEEYENGLETREENENDM